MLGTVFPWSFTQNIIGTMATNVYSSPTLPRENESQSVNIRTVHNQPACSSLNPI
jgi:hypothetical protein